MLPNEVEMIAALQPEIAEQLRQSGDLHTAVIGLLVNQKPKPIKRAEADDPWVSNTVIGLFIKACRTYRSIEILCQAGLGRDAQALCRVLFETTCVVLFILKEDCRARAAMYHAHCSLQDQKLAMEALKSNEEVDPQLKEALSGIAALITEHLSKVPADVSVKRLKRHWSGVENTREMLKTLGMEPSYVLYSYISATIHASDVTQQAVVSEDAIAYKLLPSSDSVSEALGVAKTSFWMLAMAIDEGFALGLEEELGRLRPAGFEEFATEVTTGDDEAKT